MLCYRLIKPTEYKLNCKRLQTSHRNIKICTLQIYKLIYCCSPCNKAIMYYNVTVV